MVRKALALLVMVTVVGLVLGVVGLLHPNTVDAQAPSATRSFSGITSVSAGGELSVMITAREYGSPGRVEETLPDGFTYVDLSTVPGPEDIRVTTVVGDDGRTTVRFTLDGDDEFTYRVTASSTEGDYSFSGILRDDDRDPHQISGDRMITVGAAGEPDQPMEPDQPTQPDPAPTGASAMRSFSGITSVSADGELSVMITAREYGSPGRVEETLPDGFSYVDGSTVPGPEDIRVTTVVGDDGRTTVRFTLDGDEEFTYKVTASSTEGEYTFNGVLKDEDRAPHQIRGDSMITVVGAVATRSLPTEPVRVGTQVDVMITARGYGSPGRVEETLPDGFSYVEGSTTPGPEDIRVTTVAGDDGRTTVRFTLDGDEEFTYKVTASSTEGEYTFNGVLKDEDRNSYPVGGDSGVTVRTRATIPPAPRPGGGGGGVGVGGSTNRAPVFREGVTAARSVAEDAVAGASVGSPVTASDNDGDSITYSLAGDDASLFAIGARTGQISVAQGTALDFETRSSYSVRARADDGRNSQDTIAVTIAVTNVEEAGTVGLSSANPEVGVTLTAMLEDPDGGVSDVSWSWERSMDLTTWMAIPGSGSAAYTPTEADEGYHLRATAAYSDDHDPNKRADMVSANLVPVAPEPTATPTPEPTVGPEPTATPTPEPTVGPEPTATPTPEPTVGPEPTATPTPEPTVGPEPAATPTPEPTVGPEPTATPTPEPGGPEDDDGGFPIWAIVLLVVGVPALIGGGWYLLRRLRA